MNKQRIFAENSPPRSKKEPTDELAYVGEFDHQHRLLRCSS